MLFVNINFRKQDSDIVEMSESCFLKFVFFRVSAKIGIIFDMGNFFGCFFPIS